MGGELNAINKIQELVEFEPRNLLGEFTRRLHISVDSGCAVLVGIKFQNLIFLFVFLFIPSFFNPEPHGWWDYLSGDC